MHQEASWFYSSEQVSNLKMAFVMFLKLFHMMNSIVYCSAIKYFIYYKEVYFNNCFCGSQFPL